MGEAAIFTNILRELLTWPKNSLARRLSLRMIYESTLEMSLVDGGIPQHAPQSHTESKWNEILRSIIAQSSLVLKYIDMTLKSGPMRVE